MFHSYSMHGLMDVKDHQSIGTAYGIHMFVCRERYCMNGKWGPDQTHMLIL